MQQLVKVLVLFNWGEMKKWLLVLVGMCFGLMTFGNRISETEARIVAVNWLNSTGNSPYSEENIQTVYSKSSGDTLLLYIVTFKPEGWVMVSATDKVEPVLGYSATSSVDANNLPVQMDEWISGIQREIGHACSNNYLPKSDLAEKWNQSKTLNGESVLLKSAKAVTVGPLVACTWDQGKYYNEMAPYDASSSTGNNHVWIGCVATAIAQIMKYWEYPAKGMGSFSYVHPVYGLQSANFGETEYNWAFMPYHLTEGNKEVQQISYHVAVGIRMNFDPQGSGTYLEDAQDALVNYFRYNSTIFESSKSDWDEATWKSQLKDEINKGRPVIYSGYNAAGYSGHAFVCDGYTNDYFHFNWGWGGYANGNFLLSALNPAGTNYSYKQVALMGITPIETSSIGSPYIEGFESGSSNLLNLVGVASINSNEKHSGNNSVALSQPGFSSNSLNSISLAFLVPSNGHLNFWVKRSTKAISTKNQQSAKILTQYGQTELISIFSGDYNDADWVNYSVDLSAFQGQTVRFMIAQENFDLFKEQWMYVDDIVITNGQNLSPFVPSSPAPLNISKKIPLEPQLKWSGGDMNGDAVTYSVYFGTTYNPPLVTTTATNQFSPGPLAHSTNYYWKVVANDGAIQTEGPVWSFTTRDLPPDLNVCGVSKIGQTSASVCGQIIDTNNSIVTSVGICWGLAPNVSLSNDTLVSTVNTNPYSCELTNLLPYSTYYIKAYAHSSEGLAYSSEKSFQTLPGLPVVRSAEVSNVKRTSATVGGVIQSKNDAAILNCGVVWSIEHDFDPDLANAVNQSGNWIDKDSFWIDVNKLAGPAMIYFRTYAENSVGRSYSEEDSFETFNTAPNIDLDFDNSSFMAGNQFAGTVSEQGFDGHIADVDVLISDLDNDTMTQLRVVVRKQLVNELEYLMLLGEHSNVNVQGNRTDTLVISAPDKTLNLEVWNEILRNIVFYIDEDEPRVSFLRQAAIWVNDGFTWSEAADVLLTVQPVNDAPLNILPPIINGVPEINSTLTAVAGNWNDLLDQTTCTFKFEYQWQVKRNGEISDIPNATDFQYKISGEFCSDSIRVIESVIDENCGGPEEATASKESNWVVPQKAGQTLTFDPIPSMTYTKIPFVLNGHSSSNLPLTYEANNNEVLSLSNDTVFIDATGKVVISCIQEGNACYFPSEMVYRILTVNSGTQKIVTDGTATASYADRFMPVFAKSTVGLPLSVECSDSSIAVVLNDTIYFQDIGTVTFTFTQPGNEFVTAAEPVVATLTIDKGQQLVSANVKEVYQFGDSLINLNVEINSGLTPQVEVSDSTVLRLMNGVLQIVGVGSCEVSISQQGNEFYYPAEQVTYSILVEKGYQQIEMELESELRYGIGELPLVVRTNSNLPFEIESTDTSVVQVINGKPLVVGVGQTSLLVSNSGNAFWNEVSTEQTVNVLKGVPQVLAPDTLQKHFGDNDFELLVTVGNGLPAFRYEIANPSVLEETDGLFSIKGLGETNVVCTLPGNDLWESFAASVYVLVAKGIQIITFNPLEHITYGDSSIALLANSNAGLELSFESSNGDVATVIGNVLYVLNAGETTISIVQGGNDFWEPAEPVTQLLVVNKAQQLITSVLNDTLYMNDQIGFDDFSVSSALPIDEIRSSNEQVIKVNGSEINILNAGQVTLTAVQTGNRNYEAVEKDFSFMVAYPLGVQNYSDYSFTLFPNPATNQIHIALSGDLDFPVKLWITNINGQKVIQAELEESRQIIDVSTLPHGVYLMGVSTIMGIKTGKLVIE